MKENKNCRRDEGPAGYHVFCWNGCDADFAGIVQMVWNRD